MRSSDLSLPAPPLQYELAIDHAPPKVRRHGYRDAHSRPLVSRGKRGGVFGSSFRVAPWDAWDFPSLELRAGNTWPALILDCDGLDASLRLADAYLSGQIAWPNWIVTRRSSGGSHGVWCLGKPVHRGERAREAPLKLFARVSEFMAEAVGADAGYVGVLTHNPMSRGHRGGGAELRTTWGRREPYALGELAEVIPFGWRKPKVASTEVGRNCDLFRALMRWAGSGRNLGHDVLAAAHTANQDFANPLGRPEVDGVARSVERYRRRWIVQGRFYTDEEREAWGRARGRASGAARRGRTMERDAAIARDRAAGATIRALAERYGIGRGRRCTMSLIAVSLSLSYELHRLVGVACEFRFYRAALIRER